MNMELAKVIKKPIITEKTTEVTSLGKYAFQVDRRANKKEIATAVEKFHNVHVQKVWTAMMSGKRKKAIVQLAKGEKIDIFETGE